MINWDRGWGRFEDDWQYMLIPVNPSIAFEPIPLDIDDLDQKIAISCQKAQTV